jgi:DNA polymerase-1
MSDENDDKRLFLLDAFALIYRAYFSFIRAPRVNSKGSIPALLLGSPPPCLI